MKMVAGTTGTPFGEDLSSEPATCMALQKGHPRPCKRAPHQAWVLKKGSLKHSQKLPGKNVGARCWKLTPHMATAAATSQHVPDLQHGCRPMGSHSFFRPAFGLGRGFFFGPCEGAPLGPAKGLSLQWFS